MSNPRLILGGAYLGTAGFSTVEEVRDILQLLQAHGIHEIDSAALYPLENSGRSEELLGQLAPSFSSLQVDSKILINVRDPKGSLSAASINQSLHDSMARLNTKLNILYCHLPDPDTAFEETARAMQPHHDQGKFAQLGLCNFSPPQIDEYMTSCTDHNLTKPTVFQCQYNAICRGPETMFPFLRKHNMSIMAYSPLAGGFLTGKATRGVDVAGTRFDEANPTGANYRLQYNKPVMHAAVRMLMQSCDEHEVDLTEAALRWMYHHSALDERDGIILGATRIEHARENLERIARGPLPAALVDVFQSIWHVVASERINDASVIES